MPKIIPSKHKHLDQIIERLEKQYRQEMQKTIEQFENPFTRKISQQSQFLAEELYLIIDELKNCPENKQYNELSEISIMKYKTQEKTY